MDNFALCDHSPTMIFHNWHEYSLTLLIHKTVVVGESLIGIPNTSTASQLVFFSLFVSSQRSTENWEVKEGKKVGNDGEFSVSKQHEHWYDDDVLLLHMIRATAESIFVSFLALTKTFHFVVVVVVVGRLN